jgi:hypothetical protein
VGDFFDATSCRPENDSLFHVPRSDGPADLAAILPQISPNLGGLPEFSRMKTLAHHYLCSSGFGEFEISFSLFFQARPCFAGASYVMAAAPPALRVVFRAP